MDPAINHRRFVLVRSPAAGLQSRALRAAFLGRPDSGNARVHRAVADTRAALADTTAMIHKPRRPWWTCRECQLPWPCRSAKDTLGVGMTAPALGMYMAAQMGEAIKDLPALEPGQLWDRFLAWTRDFHGSPRPA